MWGKKCNFESSDTLVISYRLKTVCCFVTIGYSGGCIISKLPAKRGRLVDQQRVNASSLQCSSQLGLTETKLCVCNITPFSQSRVLRTKIFGLLFAPDRRNTMLIMLSKGNHNFDEVSFSQLYTFTANVSIQLVFKMICYSVFFFFTSINVYTCS